jgi:UDPglucose 6-dehydrogenase
VEQLESKIGNLKGKRIALLGLSFKPDTDDIREASSIAIIESLKGKGAEISAYDPQATELMKQIHTDITYSASPQDALRNSDACLIVTEWDEFKKLTDKDFDVMRNRVIIEGRKTLDKGSIKDFDGICW